MEWVRLQEEKSRGHALSDRVKPSSNPVLPFRPSVHRRPSGMGSIALAAWWADTSRSRVSLQRRVKLINLPWTTPGIFHLPRKTEVFLGVFKGMSRIHWFWMAQEAHYLITHTQPWPPHRQWWTFSVDDVKANPEQLCWDRERKKKLNCYWETVPCIFLISLHWNMAADRLFFFFCEKGKSSLCPSLCSPLHMGGVSLQSAGALPHTAKGRISSDVLQISLLLK